MFHRLPPLFLSLLFAGCISPPPDRPHDEPAQRTDVDAGTRSDTTPDGGEAANEPSPSKADEPGDSLTGECEEDDECDDSEMCHRGRCVECTEDLQCDHGEVCDRYQNCVDCTRDEHCAVDEFCRPDHRCVECSRHEHCDDDEMCDRETGQCEDVGGGY